MTTHPFRFLPFLSGVLFLLIAAGWFMVDSALLTQDELRLAGPITLIVLGLLGVAATFRSRK
ncbi:hypothetical protein D9V41_15395 [Aeromicrobium phragmitis]|uniref:Uncharacterized protein n=1 Tax=Aeromicrobium phragmitis TaxID=2478914 RepID=A0A3L8PHU3_9ACTN|nr:hypothetical protein [Aeromicrobium phragmitis]RLV54610.1 hypothetical protein D9V41_15395 [Aeromicrobium phragmitis]